MLPAELSQFFQHYCEAFNALDGRAVAQFYAEPSAIAQGGKVTFWTTRAEVVQNMVALCNLYRERRYQAAQWELASHTAQGQTHAVVDLRWSIQWQGCTDPWSFNTSYNLARGPGGWSIILCTAYEEGVLHSLPNVA